MKNFIFDFGQVLVRFDENQMTACYIKDETLCNKVREVVFDRIYWDRFDDGTLDIEEAKKLMCERLPQSLQEDACKVLDNWYRNLEFIDGMRDLLKGLKTAGKKLYLLSNVGVDFAENYNSVPELQEVFSDFDGLVFSGPLHIVKPDREIFEYLLDTYNLKASDCVFVDDKQSNIDGANKVGIKGILFDGDATKLRKEIFENCL